MQSWRKIIILLIAVNLAGLIGCSQGNETEKNGVVLPFTQQAPTVSNSTVAGVCSNPLFPVRQGASWAYINSGGPNGIRLATPSAGPPMGSLSQHNLRVSPAHRHGLANRMA